MKTKKIVGCFLIGLLLASCSEKMNETAEKSTPAKSVSLDDSFKVYENLDGSFMTGISRSANDVIYPDYYGGSYIDDNGGLVIMTTDSIKSVLLDLKSRTKSSNFEIRQCEYSFNELQDLNLKLGKIFENRELANELKWISVGIDIKNNKVSVDLEDCSTQAVDLFKKKVLDSPMLKFNKLSPVIFDSESTIPVDSIKVPLRATTKSNVHLGSQYSSIGNKAPNDNTKARFVASVGCRAMRSTSSGYEHGFITAAHCLPKLGMKINVGLTDTYLGTVTSVKLNASSDAAFVAVDYDKYYPTNVTLRTKTPLYDKVLKNSSLVGYEVCIEGQHTPNVVKAKVTELNKKLLISKWTPAGQTSFYANNLVYGTYTSSQTNEGDSGAIVYVNGYVAGIHCGRTGTTHIFSSAELALKDLGLTNVWEK